jgi:hypothetical protein
MSFKIFCAELTHQNSGKFREDVVVSTVRACSIHLKFCIECLKLYYMWLAHKTRCTQVCLLKYYVLNSHIKNPASAGKECSFRQSGHVWCPWHLAWRLLSHIICDPPKKHDALMSVCRNVVRWTHTSKFRQIPGRCDHFYSQGMFDAPEIFHGLLSHTICDPYQKLDFHSTFKHRII